MTHPFDNQIGLSHRGDPDTSRAAARLNAPRSGSQKRKVLEALVAAGSFGLTAEEVARVTGMRSGASGNNAAKRLSDLKTGGWVLATETRRRTSNGAQAVVHIASPAAHAILENVETACAAQS